MLAAFCKKLGIQCETVARKANELVRLFEVKASSGLSKLGLTSSCKIVICIELAANSLNIPISKENVLKLSGLKKSIYVNNYQIVERILGLQTDFTIDVICVKLGCTSATKTARRIIKNYEETKEQNSASECAANINNAFNAAAVFLACKDANTKLRKSKVIELCRISRVIFDNATSILGQHIPKAADTANRGVKRKLKTLLEDVDEKFKENSVARDETEEDDIDSGPSKAAKMSDYDEWKRRILSL